MYSDRVPFTFEALGACSGKHFSQLEAYIGQTDQSRPDMMAGVPSEALMFVHHGPRECSLVTIENKKDSNIFQSIGSLLLAETYIPNMSRRVMSSSHVFLLSGKIS